MPRELQAISQPGYEPDAVSIRQLGKHASTLIREIEEHGRPAVVTRMGEPVVYIVPRELAQRHPLLLAELAQATGPSERA